MRQRKGTSSAVSRRTVTAAGGGMWKFYTEDSPGLKVYVNLFNVNIDFCKTFFLHNDNKGIGNIVAKQNLEVEQASYQLL